MPQAKALLHGLNRIEGDFLGINARGDRRADDGLGFHIFYAGKCGAFDQGHPGPDTHQHLHKPRQLGVSL